jgi:hypothetical protein
MKPILFSTAMVHAILAGRKTQTRRVVKPTDVISGSPNSPLVMPTVVKSPHKAGDILWVRETWGIHECEKCMVGIPALGGVCTCEYVYKADYQWPELVRWKPSIHMPREAARLFLRVTDVRAQRVQDISEEDATAEGCYCLYEAAIPFQRLDGQSFQALWDSINAKRGYGWDTNPFIWAYTFECTEQEANHD